MGFQGFQVSQSPPKSSSSAGPTAGTHLPQRPAGQPPPAAGRWRGTSLSSPGCCSSSSSSSSRLRPSSPAPPSLSAPIFSAAGPGVSERASAALACSAVPPPASPPAAPHARPWRGALPENAAYPTGNGVRNRRLPHQHHPQPLRAGTGSAYPCIPVFSRSFAAGSGDRDRCFGTISPLPGAPGPLFQHPKIAGGGRPEGPVKPRGGRSPPWHPALAGGFGQSRLAMPDPKARRSKAGVEAGEIPSVRSPTLVCHLITLMSFCFPALRKRLPVIQQPPPLPSHRGAEGPARKTAVGQRRRQHCWNRGSFSDITVPGLRLLPAAAG